MADETRKIRLTRRWVLDGVAYGPSEGEKPVEVDLPPHLADIAERMELPYAEQAKAEREATRTARAKDGGQG